MRLSPIALAVAFTAACGGAQTPAPEPAPPPPVASRHAMPPSSDDSGGIVLEGQLGFLPQNELIRVLNPATQQLGACYTQRLTERPFLAGRVELKIRIGIDGAPRWVIPLQSTLGDRPTEQCMIDHVMTLRFARPRGGETETTFPLDFAGGEDARPAVEWPATRIERAVAQHHAALNQCTAGRTGPFAVTLYAAPRGAVATAGVAVPNDGAAAAIDCLVHEVSSWRLPDPGSWYAKASFRLE